MGDEGVFATTDEVKAKVGEDASSTANAEAYINQYMTEAESYINVATGHNWTDDYAGLNVDVKGILQMAASNLAAIYVINYDLGGIGRSEAQTRVDILRDWVNACIKMLQEAARSDFMKIA